MSRAKTGAGKNKVNKGGSPKAVKRICVIQPALVITFVSIMTMKMKRIGEDLELS